MTVANLQYPPLHMYKNQALWKTRPEQSVVFSITFTCMLYIFIYNVWQLKQKNESPEK